MRIVVMMHLPACTAGRKKDRKKKSYSKRLHLPWFERKSPRASAA
jgi:hypothetical protein